ncbi:MAG: N-acetylmuramoyl-L-alanine amidase [bacterium]|nr:N-acetylmuramoyl-L-alanine amidase [bacterium]
MKALTHLLLLLTLLTAGAGPVQADSVDRAYRNAANDYYRLYRPGKFREYADNWLKTIATFEEIAQKHPGHTRAPQSLYNAGKLYHSLYKWNHLDSYLDKSIQSYRKLVITYPKVRIADDAQFEIGLIFEEYKNQPQMAYLEYQKVVDLFPQGDFVPLARRKLETLSPPPKEMIRTPTLSKAVSPLELTEAHYGGLGETEAGKQDRKRLVKKVDYWSTSDWSRMVINLQDPVRFKYQVLAEDKQRGKGRRMYLDLYNSFLPRKFDKRIAASDGLIEQARIAQFDKETVRIVLDLASLDRIKVYPFELPNQYKIVIDMLGTGAIAQGPGANPPGEPSSSATSRAAKAPLENGEAYGDAPSAADMNSKAVTLSQALGLKVQRVIIDPGHGGRDPGALGFKLREKDLALELAKQLREVIAKKAPGVEVLMTRDSDQYLSLEARTAFANKSQGDLFISIHMNAAKRSSVSGMETYYLNLTTDAYALSLAATENQTSLKSISDLQGLLHDLMTHSKIQESTELAQLVQGEAVRSARSSKMIHLRNLGVKQAPFFVLLGAQMPSILVEAGFITNRRENELLRTSRYRATLAEGIYNGLYQYMDQL